MRLDRVRARERQRRQQVAEMAREGKTYRELRAATGMSYATITKALREAGVEARNRERAEARKLDRYAALAELDGHEEGDDEAWVLERLRALRGVL